MILLFWMPDAEGYLQIPENPSLGIELNREAMKRYGVSH